MQIKPTIPITAGEFFKLNIIFCTGPDCNILGACRQDASHQFKLYHCIERYRLGLSLVLILDTHITLINFTFCYFSQNNAHLNRTIRSVDKLKT